MISPKHGNGYYATNARTGIWVAFGTFWLSLVVTGLLINQGFLSPKPMIALGVAILSIYLLLANDYSRWILFCLGVFSISVGHRAIYVGHWSYFVPLQVILVMLWSTSFISHQKKPGYLRWTAPVWLLIVWFFSISLAVNAWVRGGDWDSILAWTSPLMIGLPAFAVSRRLVVSPHDLKVLLRVLLGVTVLMSILAIVEFVYPSVESILPWFYTGKLLVAQDGFIRAPFSFWGYPAGAMIITWGMLIAYHDFFVGKDLTSRTLDVSVFFLGAVAVYLSGQRASWFALAISLTLLSFTLGGKARITAILLFISLGLLSADFWIRAETLTHFVKTGNTGDTSILSRLARWEGAWDVIQREPLTGVGYGHGLAHNVFLDIGSTIGVLPALAFGAFVVNLFVRLIRVIRRAAVAEARYYGWLFLALAVIWLVQMSVETVFQSPAFAAAHWVMMAIAWQLPRIQFQSRTTETSRRAF